jgi:hypothetical protein
MKAMQYFKLVRFSGMMAVVALSGCLMSPPVDSSTTFHIVMNSPSHFVVNDTVVDSSHLVKELKKNRVPQSEPLVIEMSTSMPFDTIRLLTQKLASAGYKPIFKGPRHANATANPAGKNPNPSRIQRP